MRYLIERSLTVDDDVTNIILSRTRIMYHFTSLHFTTLHYTAHHYTTLHYTTLHYTTLHYISYLISDSVPYHRASDLFSSQLTAQSLLISNQRILRTTFSPSLSPSLPLSLPSLGNQRRLSN